jgi:hypothetical protein
MELTAFDPAVHGFAFANEFSTAVMGSVAVGGLCAGMSFAAMDYFNARRPTPTHQTSDYPNRVPPVGSALQSYVYRRHLNAYGFEPSSLLPRLASGDPTPSPTLDLASIQNGTSFLTAVAGSPSAAGYAAEIAKLKAAISASKPVPLGMVAASGALDSHVVVAHGFDDSTPGSLLVFVYDPNHPGRRPVLRIDTSAVTCTEDVPGESSKSWKSFLVMHYVPVAPAYGDLALSAGLSVTPSPALGPRAFTFAFTLKNVGETTAHAATLDLELDLPLPVGFALPLEVGGAVPVGGTLSTSLSCDFPLLLAGQTLTVRPAFTNAFGATVIAQPGSVAGVSSARTVTVPLGL